MIQVLLARNKRGNVCVKVTMRHVRVTIVATKEQ